MRVLVTGSSGFLGWHLVRYFERTGIEVHGTYGLNRPGFGRAEVHRLDIREEGECERLIVRLSPSHLVHTAALSQTGDCERDPGLARAINVEGAANLAHAAQLLGDAAPHFVHISTDLVFNGTHGSCDESATPAPIQVYGQTKLDAEATVLQYTGKNTILRSALIFGAAAQYHQSFLQWMLQMLRGEARGKLFIDEYRSPVWVEDLRRVIEHVCHAGITGLFHCGGTDRLSRWEFGELVAQVYGIELSATLRGTRTESGLADTRPADVSLNSERLRSQLPFQFTSCRAALEQIAQTESPG